MAISNLESLNRCMTVLYVRCFSGGIGPVKNEKNLQAGGTGVDEACTVYLVLQP